jgi:hypothetical protein
MQFRFPRIVSTLFATISWLLKSQWERKLSVRRWRMLNNISWSMTVNMEHACVYQIYMHELVWRSSYQRNRVLGLRTPAEANRQEHKADGLLDGKENISLSHKHKQRYRLQLFLLPPSEPIVLAQWSASVHIDAPISMSAVTGLSNLRQVEGVTPLLACHIQVNEPSTKNRPTVCIRNILGGCWSK